MPERISILPSIRFFATTLQVLSQTEPIPPLNQGFGSLDQSSQPMVEEQQNEAEEDIALLAAIARGDREAFSRFYDRFSRPLYTLALAILHTQAEAEDALQEVMTKVWSKAQAYRPKAGKPLSWVMTLMRNHAIDRLRSLKRAQEIKEEALKNDVLRPTESDTQKETERNDLAKNIRATLAALPDDQRKALELAYFRGLTHSEIATTLNQPIGTIKARIRRGMQRMRAALSELSSIT